MTEPRPDHPGAIPVAKAKPVPPSPDPHSFGPHLRRVRAALGLKQAEVAEKCGISAQEASDLERGPRQPSFPLVCRIAEGLGVPYAEFFPPWVAGDEGSGVGMKQGRKK